MRIEDKVASHYAKGGLENSILDALRESGTDVDKLVPSDLAAIDEFHLGWRAATIELAVDLDLKPGMELLDVGAGIGGPARYFAEAQGCRVTGIDLTAEFVDVANALTRRCGLAARASFVQGSALNMPFAEASFDAATLIHVGMNIEDKAGLMAEIRRVLQPGRRLGIYDVMRMGKGDLPYPMPWAATAETSFVAAPAEYRRLLGACGFEVEAEHDRSATVLAMAARMRADAALHGRPALGLHVIMGEAAKPRLANVMAALEAGLIAPVEIIARAV